MKETLRAKISSASLLLALSLSAKGQPCVNWVHRSDVGTPGQRAHHAMAYDSDRGVTVFFGGEIGKTGSETYYNDTWEYDGNHWTEILINGTNPPARSFHAMAYDPNHRRVVMVGGQTGGTAFSDYWAYQSDGTNAMWTWLGNDAPLVAGHGMVFSTYYNTLETYGGATRIYGSSGFSLKDNFRLERFVGWTNTSSSEAYGIGVAYDTLRSTVVGVGGYTQPNESSLVSPLIFRPGHSLRTPMRTNIQRTLTAARRRAPSRLLPTTAIAIAPYASAETTAVTGLGRKFGNTPPPQAGTRAFHWYILTVAPEPRWCLTASAKLWC